MGAWSKLKIVALGQDNGIDDCVVTRNWAGRRRSSSPAGRAERTDPLLAQAQRQLLTTFAGQRPPKPAGRNRDPKREVPRLGTQIIAPRFIAGNLAQEPNQSQQGRQNPDPLNPEAVPGNGSVVRPLSSCLWPTASGLVVRLPPSMSRIS